MGSSRVVDESVADALLGVFLGHTDCRREVSCPPTLDSQQRSPKLNALSGRGGASEPPPPGFLLGQAKWPEVRPSTSQVP